MSEYTDPNKYCTICSEKGIDYHHIYSRGARDDLKEMSWNKIPICRRHHSMWHQYGTKRMVNVFKWVRIWMENNGWKYGRTAKGFNWYHEGSFEKE